MLNSNYLTTGQSEECLQADQALQDSLRHPVLMRFIYVGFVLTRCIHACMQSCFSHVWLFATLWTIACQASLSMGFSRQEYWSGLLWPPPGDLLDLGIKPVSLISPVLVGGVFTTGTPWEAPVAQQQRICLQCIRRGSGKSPGEGHGHPLQYSCLENPKDNSLQGSPVHGIAKESDRT